MRRKPLAVVFCGLLALSVTACGPEKEPNELADRVEEYKALGHPDVLVAEVRLPEAGKAVEEKLSRLLDRTYVVSGVQQAAVVDVLPGDVTLRHQVQVQDENRPADQRTTGFVQAVSSEYFKIMELRLIQGRFFTPTDHAASVPVAIVNESYARQSESLKDQVGRLNALGRRIKIGAASAPLLEIVGVVQNGSVTRDTPEVYVPYSQQAMDGLSFSPAGTPSWYLLVRTKGDQKAVAAELQRALGWKFQTMEERLRTNL